MPGPERPKLPRGPRPEYRDNRRDVLISVDVEAFGKPWVSSMVSIGAAVVEDPHNPRKQFYRELKPLTDNEINPTVRDDSFGAVRVAGSSLDGLRQRGFAEKLATVEAETQPERQKEAQQGFVHWANETLAKEGEDPKAAMEAFISWVKEVVGPDGKAVFVGFNASYDRSFVGGYFNLFKLHDLFAVTGNALDIKSYWKGMEEPEPSWQQTSKRDIFAAHPKLRPENPHTHNALDDAIEQAEEYAAMRRLKEERIRERLRRGHTVTDTEQ